MLEAYKSRTASVQRWMWHASVTLHGNVQITHDVCHALHMKEYIAMRPAELRRNTVAPMYSFCVDAALPRASKLSLPDIAHRQISQCPCPALIWTCTCKANDILHACAAYKRNLLELLGNHGMVKESHARP